MTFSDFNLDAALLRGVADSGFSEPTPIQRDGIPPALEGRDVLACAMTGSGKTAAFLLPVLHRLLQTKPGVTRVLALAPTRELAAQIVEHFNSLARYTRLRAAAVYGGVGMEPQERALRRGVDVIVACPGRLLDHMQYSYAALQGVEVLILDEADRMLDMGFLPDIRRILQLLPRASQTLFFSATMTPPIVGLARQLLTDPVVLNIERPAAPATGIRHSIYPVGQTVKASLLLKLLHLDEIGNALVFTRTKHRANRLASFLERNGVACERIHGNRSQSQRTQALAGFRDGRYRVLVATDVAARGIDIQELSHVVNFDVPNLPEDYIHRVGRTARAGATGEAFTFVSPQEQGGLRAIERSVGKSLPRKILEQFDYQGRSAEPLEIPLGRRLAALRERRAGERSASNARRERQRSTTSSREDRDGNRPSAFQDPGRRQTTTVWSSDSRGRRSQSSPGRRRRG